MAKRKHRDYENEFPSVTEVLSVLRKPGLEMWYRINSPEFINKAMSAGRTIGKATHEAIENYINTGSLAVDTEYPDEVTLALQSFALFKKENPAVKLRASETKMTSIIYEFNGTMDIIGEINGVLYAGDWKTTACKDKDKPEIYDEARTQVASYLAVWNELFATKLEKAFIVSLAKDKVAYNFEEIDADELANRFEGIFLPALKIKTWAKKWKERKA